MLTRLVTAFVAASMALTVLPPPADAQFGVRRTLKKVVRAPARIITAPARVVGGTFRTAFGVVAAVAVGTVIFDRLPRHERAEVARRSTAVVAQDPEQQVSDTYTSKDGRRQVTIVAEPMQTAAVLKNDPAVLVVADTVVASPGTQTAAANEPPPSVEDKSSAIAVASDLPRGTDGGPKTAPPADKSATPAGKPGVDEALVRMSDIPPDTQCRKVTTELEIRKKKGKDAAVEKDSNTAIFCQTAPGEWKPASA